MRKDEESLDFVLQDQLEQTTSHSKINITKLTPASSVTDYEIHNLALEWSLAEPIVMESSEDIKSKINWQGRVEPYHHQIKNLMTFCRKLPVTLITDDVGLGKTISAGLILSELMVRNRVSRTLVICPSLLGPQWIEELNSKFGIEGRWATGANFDQEIKGIYPVVATTYQTASTRLKHIKPGAFDMLILDEAHKVRNLYGGQSKPKFAKNIRQALSNRLFRYVVMLTATPIQNRLWDLYSLIDCLAVAKGHENPFGDEDHFRYKFIEDSKATARVLNPDSAEEFREILRQYLVRTRRQDVQLLFPERQVKLFRVRKNFPGPKIRSPC
ncbi:MAG: DEAD/DEAH box helicase family protein [Planctomycetaceae bacterium]|nr:DEAD/DEAH box helicase family protein [Planctomycetaceae bacterium]